MSFVPGDFVVPGAFTRVFVTTDDDDNAVAAVLGQDDTCMVIGSHESWYLVVSKKGIGWIHHVSLHPLEPKPRRMKPCRP